MYLLESINKLSVMKKILLVIAVLFSMGTVSGFAQCGDDLMKLALKEMGDAQYLKDYSIDLIKTKKDVKTVGVQFSVVLNSKSSYNFNLVNGTGNAEGLIMQLYDGDKLLGSNFDSGKFYKAFQVSIGTTKVYKLVFSFRGGEEGCGKAVMSLVKQG